MNPVNLKTLAASIPDQNADSVPDLLIRDIANDSRLVQPGSLFIAVTGFKDNGHKYLDEAARRGAVAAVVETPVDSNLPQICVDDARQAQALMAAEFYGHPARQLKVVGITGTNGKTTSTFMTESILKEAGYKTGLIGTLYNKINGQISATINTTPDSIVLQKLLYQMLKDGVSHVVMEVSSHALVMHRVTGINFTVGAITNLSPDHLDLHQDMKAYMAAKQRLFQLLPPKGIAVCNLDDANALTAASITKAKLFHYSSTQHQADLRLISYQAGNPGHAVCSIHEHTFPLYLHVPGQHNLHNSLVAASIALSLDTGPEAVTRGIANFRGIFRRFETIYEGNFRVIDDAAHNPGNINAVFDTLKAQQHQGMVVVYAIRGNRGVAINRSIAHTLARRTQELNTKALLITNCTDTASPLDQVHPDEEAIYTTVLGTTAEFTPSLREALVKALTIVGRGDTLLLIGAHPMDNVSQMLAEELNAPVNTLPRPPRFGG